MVRAVRNMSRDCKRVRFGLLIALVSLVLFCVQVSWAQGINPPQQQVSETSALDHFLIRGGAITYVILVPLSFVTIALIVDHLVNIRRGALMPDQLKVTLVELIREHKYKELLETTAADSSLLGAVLHAGLSQANSGLAVMERAMEEVLESRAAGLFRRIEFLNIIGNVSPMIGLFGTVYGMIKLFSDIVEVGGQPNPAVLAGGISIALVTTFWGLLVAIPALSVFHIIRNRIDSLLADCAVQAEELIQVFRPLDKGFLVALNEPPPKPVSAAAPTLVGKPEKAQR